VCAKRKGVRQLKFIEEAKMEEHQPSPPPPRRTLGDFGRRTPRGHVTYGFQQAYPVFDIKNYVLISLKDNLYDGVVV